MSDSMENIVRTDVIELKFQNKSQYFDGESKETKTARRSRAQSGGDSQMDWSSDEIFPNNLHNETWVGRGSGRKDPN